MKSRREEVQLCVYTSRAKKKPERSLEFSWYSVSSLSAYGRSVDCSSILTEWTQPNFEFSSVVCPGDQSFAPLQAGNEETWTRREKTKLAPTDGKPGLRERLPAYISNHGYHGILSAGTNTDGAACSLLADAGAGDEILFLYLSRPMICMWDAHEPFGVLAFCYADK